MNERENCGKEEGDEATVKIKKNCFSPFLDGQL
jgi:hypothetical protein